MRILLRNALVGAPRVLLVFVRLDPELHLVSRGVLNVDADGIEAESDLVFGEYLNRISLVKRIEFISQLHDLGMRFSWLTAGFQMVAHGAVKAAENVVLGGVAVLALTTETVGAARNRAWNLLTGAQVLDVALSELEHVAQPLVLLAFEHLLAIVEYVICILRYRPHIDGCPHALAAPVSLKVSKLDPRNAPLWWQFVVHCAQIRLLPTLGYFVHFCVIYFIYIIFKFVNPIS